MSKFRVSVTIRLDRANVGQVEAITSGLPNAEFDRLRREVTWSTVADADEKSARGRALARVNRVLDDAGLSFTDYTLESRVARVGRS